MITNKDIISNRDNGTTESHVFGYFLFLAKYYPIDAIFFLMGFPCMVYSVGEEIKEEIQNKYEGCNYG